MVIDCVTKKRYYIPCTINENSTITKGIAQMLF